MGRLFELIEAHRAAQPYPPSYRRIAEEVGVSPTTLLNWRTPTKLIDKAHLIKLARITHVPYSRVLDALLYDIGYLDESQVPRAGSPAYRVPSEDEVRTLVEEARAQAEGDWELFRALLMVKAGRDMKLRRMMVEYVNRPEFGWGTQGSEVPLDQMMVEGVVISGEPLGESERPSRRQ